MTSTVEAKKHSFEDCSDAPAVEDLEEEQWHKFGESVLPGILVRDFIPAHLCVLCRSQAYILHQMPGDRDYIFL